MPPSTTHRAVVLVTTVDYLWPICWGGRSRLCAFRAGPLQGLRTCVPLEGVMEWTKSSTIYATILVR